MDRVVRHSSNYEVRSMCPARIGVDRDDYEADDGNDEEGGLALG